MLRKIMGWGVGSDVNVLEFAYMFDATQDYGPGVGNDVNVP